jgi:hypothetical protein
LGQRSRAETRAANLDADVARIDLRSEIGDANLEHHLFPRIVDAREQRVGRRLNFVVPRYDDDVLAIVGDQRGIGNRSFERLDRVAGFDIAQTKRANRDRSAAADRRRVECRDQVACAFARRRAAADNDGLGAVIGDDERSRRQRVGQRGADLIGLGVRERKDNRLRSRLEPLVGVAAVHGGGVADDDDAAFAVRLQPVRLSDRGERLIKAHIVQTQRDAHGFDRSIGDQIGPRLHRQQPNDIAQIDIACIDREALRLRAVSACDQQGETEQQREGAPHQSCAAASTASRSPLERRTPSMLIATIVCPPI